MIATTNQAPATTTDDGSVVFDFSDRTYRIRGLERNTSPMQLKVNILASRNELVHLDVLDLAKARSRSDQQTGLLQSWGRFRLEVHRMD